MNLNYDYIIDIATGASRLSKKWRNRQWRWSELVEKCSTPIRTHETLAEYAAMSRDEQSRIKDVGGLVGGYLHDGVRKKGNVLFRSLLTLDIDFGTLDIWDDFTLAFDCAAILYSTHKHSDKTPRYRLIIPLSRRVTPEEYEPLARKVASSIGMELFDDTTYEIQRLFYWPSVSSDGDYVFEYQDSVALDVDAILNQYVDPFDASSWPRSKRESGIVRLAMKKAGDPTAKPGPIGDFCRTYSIEDAIDKLLSDVYEPTGQEGRYTYKEGHVSGGLVCYEGKFAYSHHDTDPAGGQLCNAFDLVRIHRFGGMDKDSRAQDVINMPSYKAMLDFVSKDENVKINTYREKRKEALSDFADITIPDDYSDDWVKKLDRMPKSNKIISSIANIVTILENDPAFAGKLSHDLFSGYDIVRGGLPWNPDASRWSDRDDANLRGWLERGYDITGKEKIFDALTTVLTRHTFHAVRDYLEMLRWDGQKRLERLIIDYLGADDNDLNRAMTRKQFVAAVARVYEPGIKHDQCLILQGAEGVGKSTLLAVMGGRWFNDSVTTMEGKEGMDQLRNAWIIELGELSSLKRSDVESVKAYLSKQVDIYRAAYDRRAGEHPRQCVFFGTTNESFFLKGDTGNRRFWVITIKPELRKHIDWRAAIIRDRDQLWAEAVEYYRRGECLRLTDELEADARRRQEEYNDDADDPIIGLLRAFLDTKLPGDWNLKNIRQRREWLRDAGSDSTLAKGTELRTRVCAAEFICEALGKEMSDKDYKYLARRICNVIVRLPEWERIGTSRHADRLYGIQKAFKRVKEPDEDEDL